MQLLVGGIAAPLIYASASQINGIVPFEAGSARTTTVQVVLSGGVLLRDLGDSTSAVGIIHLHRDSSTVTGTGVLPYSIKTVR